MIYAIEGMDGVGKTSCAKSLADYLGYDHVSNPIQTLFFDGVKNPEFNNTMNIIYDMNDQVIKSYFMGLGSLFACRGKDNLVLDRHFASNYFWNGGPESDMVFKHLILLIGVPDMTFLLKASVETRLQRLYGRNPNGWDLKDKEKHVLGHDKMETFLQKFEVPFIPIDTNNRTEVQVFKMLKNEVTLLQKNRQQGGF